MLEESIDVYRILVTLGSVEPPEEETKGEDKALEDIYSKTKTHPSISFLPLTDEEVVIHFVSNAHQTDGRF